MSMRQLLHSMQGSLRVCVQSWSRARLCTPSASPMSKLCRTLCHRMYTTSSTSAKATERLVPEKFYSKINVKVKAADYMVLESYCRFVRTAAKALGIDMGGRVALPTRIQKFTVLKSPHIYKKHRVQYEIRTHARLMQVKKITGTTADIFLEYIQRDLPEGVSMSVYQHELSALPALLVAPPEGDEAQKEAGTKTKK